MPSAQSITTLADGGYVITYNNFTVSTNADTYAQRFDAAGEKVGTEIFVNTTLIDVQTESEVVALDDGGFVIVWVGAGMVDGLPLAGLFAQRYDVNSAAVGVETRIVAGNITGRYFNTETPVAAALEDGGYVLAWARTYGSAVLGGEVLTQQFDADGTARGTPTRVDPTLDIGKAWYPTITSLTGGGYVISWTDSNDVYAQIYDNAGATVGEKFMVNTYVTLGQEVSFATGLSDGGFVIAWHSAGQVDGVNDDIFVQRFDATGAKVGDETQVNTYVTSAQRDANVTALTDGGYVIIWSSYHQDGSGIGCYGQQFDASGATVGDEFRINTRTLDLQYQPDVAALPDGGFVVTWYHKNTGQTAEIMQKIFASVSSVVGSDEPDDLEGTSGNDVINGVGGADVLRGYDGDDALDGGTGADTMLGGAGDDTYYYGSGDSVSELGGTGIDLVISSASSVTLSAGLEYVSLVGSAVSAVGNELNNIMTGNGANNILLGGKGNDELAGGLGNDRLNGGTGADTMLGGEGNDTFQYGSGDTIFEMENGGTDLVLSSVTSLNLGNFLENVSLTGSALNANGNTLNNVMIGNGFGNLLQGSGGNDTISGMAGDDVINGGKGADLLSGGEGNDVFVFNNLLNSSVAAADRIMDFAAGDVLDLHWIDANVHLAGDQAFFQVSALTGQKGGFVLSFDAVANTTTLTADANGDKKIDMMILFDGNVSSTEGWIF